MDDMSQKGRSLAGERNEKAKLTEEKVREIRRRAADGEAVKDLAEAMQVSGTNIYYIVARTTWRHIE